MPNIKCRICTSEFYVKPIHIRYGWGKYCSLKCRHLSQRKGKYVNCEICSKRIYKAPASLAHSKSGKYFCSKSCQTYWRNHFFSGAKHANWKGGVAVYREILAIANMNRECVLCGISNEMVLVAHHKDHNRNNNVLSNLLWLCMNCHYLVHHNKTLDLKVRKM